MTGLTWHSLFEDPNVMGGELYDLRITFTGSRSIDKQLTIDRILNSTLAGLKKEGYFIPNLLFIIGGAKGVDTLIENYAIKHNIPYVVRKADWDKYKKRAGMLRNIEMVDKAQRVLAIWDGVSNGTKHTINYAKSKGIPVLTYTLKLKEPQNGN